MFYSHIEADAIESSRPMDRECIVKHNTQLGAYVVMLKQEMYGRIGMARESIAKMESLDYPDEDRKRAFLEREKGFVDAAEQAMQHLIGAERVTQWKVESWPIPNDKVVKTFTDVQLIEELHNLAKELFPK